MSEEMEKEIRKLKMKVEAMQRSILAQRKYFLRKLKELGVGKNE